MTLTTAKGKAASKRFPMARLTVSYYPVGWAYLGSGPHRYSFPWSAANGTNPPFQVAVAGTTYTEVSSLAALTTTSQWFYDSATGTLYVTWPSASTPNAADNSNGALVVSYYLYFTSGETRYAPSTPTGAGNIVEYEPRISDYSPAEQSFRNILAGVITVSDMSMTLVNRDGEIGKHFTGNHSHGDLSLWLCIDSLADGLRVYSGSVVSYSQSAGEIGLSVANALAALDQPCLMGDPINQAYLTNDGALVNINITSLSPGDIDAPVPYIAGRYSTAEYYPTLSWAGPTITEYLFLRGLRAKCVEYSTTKSATKNRMWRLGRIGSTGLRAQVLGTIEASVHVSLYTVAIRFSSHNLVAGEWILYNGTRYAKVVKTTPITLSGTPYNCVVWDISGTGVAATSVTPLSNPIVMAHNTSLALYPFGYNVPPTEYTVYSTPTDGGNTVIDIEFTSSGLSSPGETGGDYLDPDSDYVYYVLMPDETSPGIKHGAVAKRMVTKAGLTVAASTFTAADSTLPLNVVMDIPMVGETDFSPYRTYLEAITESTAAYLRVNDSNEVEYNLLTNAAAGDEHGDNVVIRDSMAVAVDTQDVQVELVGYNEHIPDYRPLMDEAGDISNARVSSYKGRWLYGKAVSLKFKHVLESITDRLQFILDLRKAARRTYTYDTDTEAIDKLPGDNVTLTGEGVLGASVNVKIVGVARHDSKTTVTAIEI